MKKSITKTIIKIIETIKEDHPNTFFTVEISKD